MLDTNPRSLLFRCVIALLGFSTAGIGLFHLRSETTYTNWWGGLAFAPLGVLFGIGMAAMAILKPEWLGSKLPPRW